MRTEKNPGWIQATEPAPTGQTAGKNPASQGLGPSVRNAAAPAHTAQGQDTMVKTIESGQLAKSLSTSSFRHDGIAPRPGTAHSVLRLRGGASNLPRSGQKAPSAKASVGSGRTRYSSSSPNLSSSSEDEDFEISLREQSPTDSATQQDHPDSAPNEIKSYLANNANKTYALSGVERGPTSSRSTSPLPQQNFERFVVSSANLLAHGITPSQDYVPHGTQIFQHTGWTSVESLKKEAGKHRELNREDILVKVENLGRAATSNTIYAYIYRHDHYSINPAQRRTKGDVVIIDEEQGILAAFSSKGRIKTARIDSPEALRNYLQSEKYKDLHRDNFLRKETRQ